MSVALNILLILLELWAFRLVANRKWKNFIFYTQLSNITTFLSCIALLIAGKNAAWLRYLSVCMMTMTGLVTAFILVPMGGDPKILLWSGNGLYHHVLCPAINFISYMFFEEHVGYKMVILPVLVTLLYGLVMLYMNWIQKADGPYPFFRVRHQTVVRTVVWMAALVAMIGVISALVCLVAT